MTTPLDSPAASCSSTSVSQALRSSNTSKGRPLEPLRILLEASPGSRILLPSDLATLYGPLAFPQSAGRPHVLANFVTSLDGVVALDAPGAGGGAISGYSAHDQMVMGLLRAVTDAVVVGAGTLRAEPDHIWTPEYIFPPLAADYARLRSTLGMTPVPLTVIVTASADIDLTLPVFQSGVAPVLVVTTDDGLRRVELRRAHVPSSVSVVSAASDGPVAAHAVLAAIARKHSCGRILVEGGPHLLAAFLTEGCIDELFLTLAPQVAGRRSAHERLSLVEGALFAPEHPIWTQLLSVRQAQSHLFLRYAVHPAD